METWKAPNIVYLHAHDTGRHISPYGVAAVTPRLQRLAESGLLFRRAYSTSPTCSPSRAAQLTGRAPHSTGMLGLAHRGFAISDHSWLLPSILRKQGYQTVLAGFQHLTTDHPSVLGYDVVPESADVSAARVAERVSETLRKRRRSSDKRPFFIDAGCIESHRPFHEVPASAARYVRQPAPLPDTPETRLDTAGFLASIHAFDTGVGAVLDALESAGLSESTFVFVTTDHGPPFPGMKCTLTDHGLGVLLIMKGPGGLTGGNVSEALVSHIDLLPTVLEIAGIEVPSGVQGKSLVPVISGDVAEVHDAVYGEVTYHAAYEPMRSIRTGRWTYIRRFGGRETPVLPNIDDSLSRRYWIEHGWSGRLNPPDYLFDNVFDPNQANNLAGFPEYGEMRAELSARLDHWMEVTEDPLRLGPVPLPPGGVTDDPDDFLPDQQTL